MSEDFTRPAGYTWRYRDPRTKYPNEPMPIYDQLLREWIREHTAHVPQAISDFTRSLSSLGEAFGRVGAALGRYRIEADDTPIERDLLAEAKAWSAQRRDDASPGQ